ncbi:MAG TPA: helix-turn-helix transcriptional regulator [Opitutaceae bacterium]
MRDDVFRVAPRFAPMSSTRLQLQDWSNLHADLSWVYEGAVEPVHRDAPYRPDLLGAWLVLDGAARLTQQGRTLTARPGEWLIIRQASGHQHFSDDAKILSVRFTAEWPDRKPFYDEGLSRMLKGGHHPKLEAAARTLVSRARPHIPEHTNMLHRQAMSFADFVGIRRAFWSWLVELHEALAVEGVAATRTLLHDERIVKVVRELDHLPLDARLREGPLAKSVGLQVGHFVRTFREQVGRTPKRYFDELRRTACRKMLTGSETPIKEIALNLGFARLSDFSAWFRRAEGVPPRKYRQLYKKSGGAV